jgi:hypothetical protein
MTQQTLRQRNALRRLLAWLQQRSKAPQRVHCDPALPADEQADHRVTIRRKRGDA